MEVWLEEMHHEFVSRSDYYPRMHDIEYEYEQWALESERPSVNF